MKKLLKIFAVCLFACLLACFAFACPVGDGTGKGGGNQNGIAKPIKFGVDLLKDCSVDVEDDDRSLAVEVKKNESVAANNKGYLVSFDKKNKLRQVKFVYERVKTNGDTDEVEITQEEIEASLSNLFVTKRFTYLTFTPRGYDDSALIGRFTADAIFLCDVNHQSFIIDNETHKLYPTNAIGKFTNIKENFVYIGGYKGYNGYSGGKFYELTVDGDGNLASRKIVPNDNITESEVIIDKFGQVFVLNSSTNETKDNFVYYTSAASPKYLGDDGFVYEVETINGDGEVYQIKYYDQNLQLKNMLNDVTVRFGGYLAKNNRLYYLMDSKAKFYSWLYHLKMSGGLTQSIFQSGNLTESYTYKSENKYCIVGHEVFEYHNVNGTKTLFYFDTDTLTSTQEITTFTDLEIVGNSLILTREMIDGTKKYEVRVNNGVISLELLVDITYQNEIITIQPLN